MSARLRLKKIDSTRFQKIFKPQKSDLNKIRRTGFCWSHLRERSSDLGYIMGGGELDLCDSDVNTTLKTGTLSTWSFACSRATSWKPSDFILILYLHISLKCTHSSTWCEVLKCFTFDHLSTSKNKPYSRLFYNKVIKFEFQSLLGNSLPPKCLAEEVKTDGASDSTWLHIWANLCLAPLTHLKRITVQIYILQQAWKDHFIPNAE